MTILRENIKMIAVEKYQTIRLLLIVIITISIYCACRRREHFIRIKIIKLVVTTA